MQKRGFTLIELLIVIAIITVITAIISMVLNPVEYLRQARDSQRLQDYTLINQAVNYYSYGASLRSAGPDLDGPNHSETCIGEDQPTLYVSVPADNGEFTPDPPSNWQYNRVPSSPLRNTNGDGWLPIDFQSVDTSDQALHTLPIDPVNTFTDGYYYTYICGSFELNLRFETEKFAYYALNDGGDDPNLYEIGSTLIEAPTQDAYNGGSQAVLPSAVTIALSPAQGAMNAATSSVVFSWQSAANTNHYALYYGLGPYNPTNLHATTTQTSLTIPILAEGTNYTWRVDTFNSNGSASGTVFTFTTASSSPPSPTPTGTILYYPTGLSTQAGNTWTVVGTSRIEAINEAAGLPDDADYLTTNTNLADEYYTFSPETAPPASSTVTAVRIFLRASQTGSEQLVPYSWDPTWGWDAPSASQIPVPTLTPALYSWETTHSWTWSDIANMELGVTAERAQGAFSSDMYLYQLYAEVDYQI